MLISFEQRMLVYRNWLSSQTRGELRDRGIRRRIELLAQQCLVGARNL
jgi:hypothetical protein